MRAIVVGSVTIDHQVHPDGAIVRQVGGTAVYAAAAFRAAGWDVLSIANLGGPDEAAVQAVLDRLGLACRAGRSATITAFRNHLGAGGARWQELVTVAPPITIDEVAPDLDRADVVHLGPLHGEDIDGGVFLELSNLRGAATLDAQGLLRTSAPGEVAPTVSAWMPVALECADFLKLAAHEASTLEQAWSVPVAKIAERHAIDEVVITRGSDGGEVLRGRDRLSYSAARPARVIDATGAGDVFFASYVAGRLGEGLDPRPAAARAARQAARQVGGGFLDREQLRLPG